MVHGIFAQSVKTDASVRAAMALIKNVLRNSVGGAVKKYLCLTEGSFKDFQLHQLNFSIFDHSLEFFAYFLFQDKK